MTDTGTDRVELTKDEKRALNIPLVDTHSTNLYAAVESIVAARVQALTAEREELRTSLDYWVELWKKAANGVIGLQADLSEARAELAAANARCAELEANWMRSHEAVHLWEKSAAALQATLDRVSEVYGFLMRKYADPDADAATVLAVTRTSLRAALTPEGTE